MKLKKLLSLLLVLTFLLSIFPDKQVQASSSTILVLIQNWKGDWIAYNDMTVKSPSGAIMVNARKFSDAMEYTFSGAGFLKSFKIMKNQTSYNTYNKDNKAYTWQSSQKSVNKLADYKAYYSDNAEFFCHYKTLGTLCRCKYYGKSALKNYADQGVSTVICYSNKEISGLPDINKVKTVDDLTWVKTFVEFNIKEPLTTDIYGVTFTAPTRFMYPWEVNWDEDKEFAALQAKQDEFKATYENGEKFGSGLDLSSERLTYNYDCFYSSLVYNLYVDNHVDSSFESADDDFYYNIHIARKLYIPVKNILKAICYKISSTPETLYQVILYDHETKAFLSSKEWKQYGDFEITVDYGGDDMIGGYANYSIRMHNR
jgi:hypothetical protein